MEKYQDYVIKDGQFIGNFEEMYRKFEDPWHQMEELGQSYSRNATIVSIKAINCKKVLEIGCGLGAFTYYMHKSCPTVSIVGMDISETAVNKARNRYSECKFVIGNIADDILQIPQINKFDCCIFSEIIWYILPDLKKIFNNIKEKTNIKYILINQVFYRQGQKYGKEYFTNLEEMIKYIPFSSVGYNYTNMENNQISYETHSIFKVM